MPDPVRSPRICRTIAVFVLCFGPAAGRADDAAKVDFSRDIRPIFARNCHQCHGPDKHEGGLRLDMKSRAVQGGDSGPAIVAGRPDESLLLRLVSGSDPDRVMPPKGDRLTAGEIARLRLWIEQGAAWPDDPNEGVAAKSRHWAFQPIRVAPIPVVGMPVPTPPQNAIDDFIRATLEAKRLNPSGEADRHVLVRRLSLDLLGLPPTPEEVADFLADHSPDAWERLTDRLLASPHFGERWGRHWLDLARYADSDGYEKDLPRPYAWRYRHWVIDAYNADLPFDKFTLKQLAGDLLPEATTEDRVATGFHRQTLTNREGGIDPKEDRDKQVVDRVNTTGTVWLGLTIGCAQCHSHKYDPISQREYYQLYAFFNSANETDVRAPLPWEEERYQRRLAEHNAKRQPFLEAIKADRREGVPKRLAAWEARIREQPPTWDVLQPQSATAASGAQVTKQDDGTWLVTGELKDVDTYTLTVDLPGHSLSGLKIEALPDERLPGNGPGRTPHGNFVLTEVKVTRQALTDGAKPEPVPMESAQADAYQSDGNTSFPPNAVFDGAPRTGWAISPDMGKPHVLQVEFAPQSPIDGMMRLTITLEQQYGGQHTLGKFRLSVSRDARPLPLEGVPNSQAALLAIAPAERTAEQQQALLASFEKVDPEALRLQKALGEFDQAGPKPPATQAMAFVENPKPEPTRIHHRGDFLQPGEEVAANTLSVLHPLHAETEKPNRRDLAAWLVSQENPLTRRVVVNRMWQTLFGRGIVDPPNDFGTQGTPPTHPELLDWLATELSRREWSQKAVVRLIVSSATYRQTSQGRPDIQERDPKNLLLARQNRLRLEGELIRDLTLAVSGLLNDDIGGPSIRPPLPAGMADLGYAGGVKWPESQGAERYRRGCYIFFQRTVPYPLLMTFDGPDSNVTCTRRERSNTPLQSLTLLNDPVFFEGARKFGETLANVEPLRERIQSAYRFALGRDADEFELRVLETMSTKTLDELRGQPEAARQILGGTGEALTSEQLADRAAAVLLGRVVMNLDEFYTRE